MILINTGVQLIMIVAAMTGKDQKEKKRSILGRDYVLMYVLIRLYPNPLQKIKDEWKDHMLLTLVMEIQ